MSTIPETMKTISRDIQYTFEELIKLLLRKSLRPVLNPIKPNNNVVYNNFKGKYERGLIGSTSDDNINKYNYIMTSECIGWTGENLTNFKVAAKFIKNNTLTRFPAGNALIHNNLKNKSKIAYSNHELEKNLSTGKNYNTFLSFLTSRSVHNIIANKQATFLYTCDVPYTHSFKQLESIGQDIIDQTDPCIAGEDSAKMSTAMLRVKLYNLEQDLENLSVAHPEIFDEYIRMVHLINSIPKNKLVWVINLTAALTYQRWTDLSSIQQQLYLESLGENFIREFNGNELITILLQSNSPEIILTSSYLYSLLKMLFVVFGYSKLAPVVIDRCGLNTKIMYDTKMGKHLNKYRGASYRRGEEPDRLQNNADSNNNPFGEQEFGEQEFDNVDPSENFFDRANKYLNTCSSCSIHQQPNSTPNPNQPSQPNYQDPLYDIDIEPIDQCVYDFIKLFGDLYPTIVGLMGGVDEFPPEYIKIACDDIPSTYNELYTIPQYLWRFNDYSYCRYLEYVDSRQISNALNAKINAKVKYMQSL